MNLDLILFGMDISTVVIFLLVVVFGVGVVWRVEAELDTSYKFLVVSAISLMLAEVVNFSATNDVSLLMFVKGLRFLGAVCFLVSILLMRDITRKLDHEKK